MTLRKPLSFISLARGPLRPGWLAAWLAALLLVAQFGLLAHDYHAHDEGDVCEICVSFQHIKQVLPAALPHYQGSMCFAAPDELLPPLLSSLTVLPPQARGPPPKHS